MQRARHCQRYILAEQTHRVKVVINGVDPGGITTLLSLDLLELFGNV